MNQCKLDFFSNQNKSQLTDLFRPTSAWHTQFHILETHYLVFSHTFFL